MRNLLRGRDNGPKYPDSSSHSSHYAPQHLVFFDSFPHLLATITLRPTSSWSLKISYQTVDIKDEIVSFYEQGVLQFEEVVA